MQATLIDDVDVELSKVRVHRWIGAASLNWCLIAFTFAALAAFSWPTRVFLLPFALIVIGTRQHSLALLAHDAAHHLCSRNRFANDFLATVFCAYPLTVSLRAYRRFHFAHHRHVGTDGDPEFAFKGAMGSRWDPPVARKRVVWQFAKDCVGLGLKDILETSKTLKPIDLRDWLHFLAFWAAVLSGAVLIGQVWVLVVWFVALSTVQWAVFRVRIWTEHAGLGGGETHRFHANWWQRAFLFPMNTWCHYEHHEAASTPFHSLPELRRRLTSARVVSLGELFDQLSRMPPSATGQVPSPGRTIIVELPSTEPPSRESESRPGTHTATGAR